jgi:hypothetical protein
LSAETLGPPTTKPAKGCRPANAIIIYAMSAEPPDDIREGRPLAIDPDAISTNPDTPAFIAKPAGAPVYYGFPLVAGAEVDGFQFGMITDFLTKPATSGDAYVVAPDGSRCGLVWETGVEPHFDEVRAPERDRWGVWAVGLPLPLQSADEACAYLRALLPELRPRWEACKRTTRWQRLRRRLHIRTPSIRTGDRLPDTAWGAIACGRWRYAMVP